MVGNHVSPLSSLSEVAKDSVYSLPRKIFIQMVNQEDVQEYTKIGSSILERLWSQTEEL
jgi:hypothetical protein